MMKGTTYSHFKDGLWLIFLAGLLAAIIRFTRGLGAVTGMNDSAPWGLWIAFKLVFVALAGGGFTLAGMVYVFHMERYRPILRRAILIALLGYGSFIVSLIFDLGLPWHIYMPILNWQHHSVMFEIAWCVILYFSVLLMEFSPVILEHPMFRHPIFRLILRFLHRFTPALVIAGIILSTLHQSSLGSLFLIMPHRVHPLWYSPWIPYLFFTSAIAAGLMALVVEAFLVERWFQRKVDFDLLLQLGRGAMVPLSLYLVLRIGDQMIRGVLPGNLDSSWQSVLFLSEVLLGGILPILLLSIKKIRHTRQALLTSAILVILGIMSQRMSLSMFTMYRAEGTSYAPALGEILIALGIPAAAILLYLFFTENFQVFGKQPHVVPERDVQKPLVPKPATSPLLRSGLRNVFARRSGFAVFVFALTLPVLTLKPDSPANPVKASTGWEILHIDGNQSGYAVDFPHLEHQNRIRTENSQEEDCHGCHHLELPNDEVTACWECHVDFYQQISIFNHKDHQNNLGGNESCLKCHQADHAKQDDQICQNCHKNMVTLNGATSFSMLVPSYKDAMHNCCLKCHEKEASEHDRAELKLCSTCHTYYLDESDQLVASLFGR